MSHSALSLTAAMPCAAVRGNWWRCLSGAIFVVLSPICCVTIWTAPVQAQPERYAPLRQTVPPGIAGAWAGTIRPGLEQYFQPIKVELPCAGQVTFYGPNASAFPAQVAPAQADFLVGPVYRLKLSDLDDFPGVDLYPTVELISRLHPPAGRAAEYPVPLVFTGDEIRTALRGQMVTKVIYLEQPDRAIGGATGDSAPTRRASRREDALVTADELGRPMAIIRLGGRQPPEGQGFVTFFGAGAPVQFSLPETAPARANVSRTSAKGTKATPSHDAAPRQPARVTSSETLPDVDELLDITE